MLKFEPRFVNHLHLQLGESAVDLLNGVINTLVSFCTGYANEETVCEMLARQLCIMCARFDSDF